MSLPFPWTFSSDDPAGGALENRLQDVLDVVGTQFPVSGANLANDVLKLAVTGTPRSVAFGSASLNFPGAATSSQLTIPHGLGATPVFFAYFPEAPSDNIADAVVVNYTQAPDAVNFYVTGKTISGVAIGPGTNPGRWLAIA